VDYYNANRETHFKQEQKTSFLLIEIPKGDDAGAALQKAQKVLQEAKSGKDFLQCINEYSEGVKDKTGGLWETKDPQSFAAPYNAIAAKLDAMSVNDVSEIIDGGSRFFIVKLLENKKGGYIAVEDVQQDIEKHLKGIKRKEQMEKMLRELFEQADITGLEGFMQYCIRQAYLRTRG
jgi:parvulin-like peptidyl-prolyl isomerase